MVQVLPSMQQHKVRLHSICKLNWFVGYRQSLCVKLFTATRCFRWHEISIHSLYLTDEHSRMVLKFNIFDFDRTYSPNQFSQLYVCMLHSFTFLVPCMLPVFIQFLKCLVACHWCFYQHHGIFIGFSLWGWWH